MNRENWKPKVGDKVMVIGHPSLSGIGEISGQIGLQPEWFWISSNRVHLRNLDPVLEDERRGAPRPFVSGEEVDATVRATVFHDPSPRILTTIACFLPDPRVRQIERRKQDLGREARKS